METKSRNNTGIFLVISLLLGLVILFVLPTLGQIKLRPHAVEKHGMDAVTARESLWNCGSGLRTKICPKSKLHSTSICFWCETGSYLCPGMYTTRGGMEKTTFMRPCQEWRECR